MPRTGVCSLWHLLWLGLLLTLVPLKFAQEGSAGGRAGGTVCSHLLAIVMTPLCSWLAYSGACLTVAGVASRGLTVRPELWATPRAFHGARNALRRWN